VRHLDQPVTEPLMVPFPMVMIGKFRNSVSKVSLAERDDIRQALGLDRADESLGVRV